jgi:hypothetical protein
VDISNDLDIPLTAVVNALSVYREHAAGLLHIPRLGYECLGPVGLSDAPVLREAVDSHTAGVRLSLRLDGTISSIQLASPKDA